MSDSKTWRNEYEWRGEYHRRLDPDWWYGLVYRRKVDKVRKLLRTVGRGGLALDAGCGEGLFLELLKEVGYTPFGVDAYYRGCGVIPADLNFLPFQDGAFDLVCCLDVLEHMHFPDQQRAVGEIARVLSQGGLALFVVPNLAHLMSRIVFAIAGRLARTSGPNKHPGDRPACEYLDLIRSAGLVIEKVEGILLTVPLLYRLFTRNPRKWRSLFKICTLVEPPSMCFEVIILARKATW